MLRKNLTELMKKPILSLDDVNEINQEMTNEASILKIFEDNDFIDSLISSKTLVPCVYNQPLFFSFLLLAFHNHVALFPILMETQKIKQIFINHCSSYRKENFEVPFFNLVLAKKSALMNLKTIIEDNELCLCFCKSRHAGRTLIGFAKENPENIKAILLNSELRKAVRADRSHHVAMRDILNFSIDKNDLDLFFHFSDAGWTYSDNLKIDQYNIIAENYRASLPNSLYKLCLFSITNNDIKTNDSTPKELTESIRNFSINK